MCRIFRLKADDLNNKKLFIITFYHIDGHALGQVIKQSNTLENISAHYSNIGSISIQSDSGTRARIMAIRFNPILENATPNVYEAEVVGYTLKDEDGDTSSATLTLNTVDNTFVDNDANSVETGTAGNDYIAGLAGIAGVDILYGGADDDILKGGEGGDTLDGGSGDDLLEAGIGDDILTGGTGADTFKWIANEQGTFFNPAKDSITDFSSVDGDKLDLSDLLQGEEGNPISDYITIETREFSGDATMDTRINIDTNAGAFFKTSQIIIEGVDWQVALKQLMT